MNIELHAGNVGSKQKGLTTNPIGRHRNTRLQNERFQDAVDFQTHPAKQAVDLVFPEIFICLHLTSCGSPYKSCMKQSTWKYHYRGLEG